MINQIEAPALDVSLDTVTTTPCIVKKCRRSFRTTEPVSANARYICREHTRGFRRRTNMSNLRL